MIALLAQVVVVLCAVGIGVMVGRKFMGREGRLFELPGQREYEHKERALKRVASPAAIQASPQLARPALRPVMRRAIEQVSGMAGRLTIAARRIANQARPAIIGVIRRSQAQFNRQRPAIERQWQIVRARSAAIIRELQPKISQALSRGKVLGRAALRIAGQALSRGRQASQKGLALAQSRIEALSHTLQHIRMRQTEHAQRMRTKEKFLGELMAKVQKPEEVKQEPAPPAPPIVPTPLKISQPAAKQAVQPPFWSRFKFPHPASPGTTAPATRPMPVVRPEEPENQERMVKILREQEQIILRQIVKHPKDIALYKRLGFVYLELGESPDAVECFRQAVKLGSQDPLVRKELQRLLAH